MSLEKETEIVRNIRNVSELADAVRTGRLHNRTVISQCLLDLTNKGSMKDFLQKSPKELDEAIVLAELDRLAVEDAERSINGRSGGLDAA